MLLLSNATVTDVFDDEKHVFQVQDFDTSVMLVLQSREEKEAWMEDIRQNIIARNRQSMAVNHRDISQRATVQNPLGWKRDFIVTGRDAIPLMKQGTTMLKYCSIARPHFRMIRLSQDERYIMWSSPKRWKTAEKCKIHVCDITKVMVGNQNTIAFRKFRNDDLAELSISIFSRSKVFGVVCTEQRDYTIWSEGLRELMLKLDNRNSVVSTALESVVSSGSDEHSEIEGSTDPADVDEEKATGGVFVDTPEIATNTKNFKEEFSKRGDAYTWGCGANGALGNGSTKDQQRPLVLRDLLCMDVQSISCNGSATALIMKSGQLFTIGSGEAGKLGHGDQGDRLKPAFIRSLRNVAIVQASVGAKHMLALDDNGIVYAWGSNDFNQLGFDDQELCPVDDDDETVEMEESLEPNQRTWLPHVIASLLPTEERRVVRVCAGFYHSACIFDDGTVVTWGRNEEGQLGLGHKQSISAPTLVEKLAGKKIVDISLGADHSVAQTEGGFCFTWGSNAFGQLGHPNFSESSTDTPKLVEFFSERRILVRQSAAGGSHTGIITENGELYMFGLGLYGQIGTGRKENVSTPMLILDTLRTNSVDRVMQVALGTNHSMILMESGKVYSWGAGTYGRLGLGNEQDTAFPTLVTFFNEREVRELACGGSQSAAVCAHMMIPDKEVSSCMGCGDLFSRSRRKHHCRFCGGLFCADCSSKSLTLLNLGYTKPVKVCDTCYALNRIRDL